MKKYFYLFVFTFIPYISISFYNHPSADDYTYALKVIERGFWQAQIDYYYEWSGRFIATLLMSFNPVVFRSDFGYKLMPVFLIFTFIGTLFFFFKSFFRNSLDKFTLLTASLGFLSLFMFRTSNIPQGFYWMAGYFNYTTCLFAVLISVGLFFRYRNITFSSEYDPSLKDSFVHYFFQALLTIFIIGSNETIMLMWCFLLVSSIAYIKLEKKKWDKLLLFLLLVGILASLVVILAPGNAVRAEAFDGNKRLFFSLGMSTVYGIWHLVRFWSVPLFAFLILMSPWLSSMKKNIPFSYYSKKSTLWIWFFYLGIVFCTFFPAFWSMGNGPQRRIINMLCFATYMFIFLLYSQYYLRNSDLVNGFFEKYKSFFNPKILFAIIAVLFVTIGKHRVAWTDLFFVAPKYNEEMKQRYNTILESEEGIVKVPWIQNRPQTIYFTDLEGGSPNSDVARYFGKQEIWGIGERPHHRFR